MNEQALQQLYRLAKGEGYQKGYNDFKTLMATNEQAIGNMYEIAKIEGYQKSLDDFKVLVGFDVKKKDESQPTLEAEVTTESTTGEVPGEDISSDSVFEYDLTETEKIKAEEEAKAKAGEYDFQIAPYREGKEFSPNVEFLTKQKEEADALSQMKGSDIAEQTLTIAAEEKAPEKKATEYSQEYQNKLQEIKEEAIKNGIVEDLSTEEDTATSLFDVKQDPTIEKLFKVIPDLDKKIRKQVEDEQQLKAQRGDVQASGMLDYYSLPDDLKEKISEAVIIEDNKVIGIDYSLLSKKTIDELSKEAQSMGYGIPDDFQEKYGGDFGAFQEEKERNEIVRSVLLNYSKTQELEYKENAIELNKLQKEIKLDKEKILKLEEENNFYEAQNLKTDYNNKVKRYNDVAKLLSEEAILINATQIAALNKEMNTLESVLFSAEKSFEKNVVSAVPQLAATFNKVRNFTGLGSNKSKRMEKALMTWSSGIRKEIEENTPTDYDDTKANFVGDVIGQIGFIAGSYALGGTPLGLSAAYSMSMGEMYDEAIQNGLAHEDAMNLAVVYGGISAPLEMLPLKNVLGRLGGKAIRKKLIDEVIEKGAKGFTREFVENTVKFSLMPILKETLKESLEEGVQEGTQFLLSKGLAETYNALKEEDKPEFIKTKLLSLDFAGELFTNIALGTVGGSIGGGSLNILGGNFFVGKDYKSIEEMLTDPKQMSKITNQINAYRKSGKIKTDEEMQFVLEQVGIVQSAASEVMNATKGKEFGIASKRKLFDLTAERLSLQKEIDGVTTPSLVIDKKQRISDIDIQIQDIISGKITEEDIIAEQEKATEEAPEVEVEEEVTEEVEPEVEVEEEVTEEVKPEVETTEEAKDLDEKAQEDIATKLFEEEVAPEVEATEEVAPEPKQVRYEMNKTDKRIWRKDFEIIDNRDGETFGPPKENGRWIVENKVTGLMVNANTKREAQNIIDNAPGDPEIFGEGQIVDVDRIITPETGIEITEEVAPEVEAKPEVKEEKAVPKVTEEESSFLSEMEDIDGQIEGKQEEISIEQGDAKQEIDRIDAEIKKVRASKIDKESKAERIDELKAEKSDYKDELKSRIQDFKDDIKDLQKEKKKVERKLKKISEKKPDVKVEPEVKVEEKDKPSKKPRVAKKPSPKKIQDVESLEDAKIQRNLLQDLVENTSAEIRQIQSKIENFRERKKKLKDLKLPTKKKKEKANLITKEIRDLQQEQRDLKKQNIKNKKERGVFREYIDKVERGLEKAPEGKAITKTEIKKVIARIKKTFPTVSVIEDSKQFNEISSRPDVRKRLSNGTTIYAITTDGKIFINPLLSNLQTPIHEFGHIWIDFLRSKESGKKGTDLLNRGFELIEGTKQLEESIKKNGDTQIAREEALVSLIADKGASILNASKKANFKDWLSTTFRFIRDKMLTFAQVKNKDIKNLSIDDFTDIAIGDLFAGKELSKKFDAAKQPAAETIRFQKDDKISSFVEKAKSQGISENVIRKVLKDKGVDSKTIDAALKKPKKKVKVTKQKTGLLKNVKNVKDIDLEEQINIAEELKDKDKKAVYDSLNNTLKELEGEGKLTARQVNNVLKRFQKVDTSSASQVESFVNYMTKVFADADYMAKIKQAESKLPKARQGVKRKTGINELGPALDRLFRINPRLIPSQFLDKYLNIVDTLSKRAKEINIELESVSKDTQDILNYMDTEGSRVNWLASVFDNYVAENKSKVEGKTFTEILSLMKEDGSVVDDSDIAIMKKYRSTISPTKATKKTEQEIQKEKDGLVKDIKQNSKEKNPTFSTNEEAALAKQLKDLVNTKGIEELSLNELKTLLQVIDNINQGLVTNNASELRIKLNGFKNTIPVKKSIINATVGAIEKGYNKVKAASLKTVLGRKKNYIQRTLESSPLYYIDLVFGDGKSKNLYDSFFRDMAEGEQKFTYDVREKYDQVENARDAVKKSFKGSENKTIESSAKQYLYMLELEYLSNKDKTKVKKASEYLDKTIELAKVGKRDIDMLEKIKKDFIVDGNVNMDKLFNSFNKAEKKSIKVSQEINQSLAPMAMYVSGIIRGERIGLLNNYVHHVVVDDKFKGDVIDDSHSLMESMNESLKPSTKAKPLIERQNVVTALNFDIYNSVKKGAKGTLLDFHLTVPIRTARATLKETKKALKKDKSYKDKQDIYEAMDSLVENTISNFIYNSVASAERLDKMLSSIVRISYQRVLADSKRFTQELLSNFSFILWKGKEEWALGYTKYKDVSSETMAKAMRNLGSLQTERVYGDSNLKSRFTEKLFEDKLGVRGKENKSKIMDVLGQINYYSLKPLANVADKVGATIISSPDQIMNRPLIKGTFASTFEKETGQPFPKDGFEKIADNDQAFMSKYKNALKVAMRKSDDVSIEAGASSGLFTGISKGKDARRKNEFAKMLFYNYNDYMNTFLNYEFQSFRKGLEAARGNGIISEKEGKQLMAAVATRMTLYSFLAALIPYGVVGAIRRLLGYAEDEDEEEKSVLKKGGQAIVQTGVGLLVGRNFGNLTKQIQNSLVIEPINEKYLGFLRDGKYDKFKDKLGYTLEPRVREYEDAKVADYIYTFSGPYNKLLTFADKALKVKDDILEPSKKADAKKREKQRLKRFVFFEIPALFGYVPIAKEVEKELNSYMYKDFRKGGKSKWIDVAPTEAEEKKAFKEIDPEGYKKIYGK